MNNKNNNKIKVNLSSFFAFLIIFMILFATAFPRFIKIEKEIDNSYMEGLFSIISHKIQTNLDNNKTLGFRELSRELSLELKMSNNKNWIVTDNDIDTVYFTLSKNTDKNNCFISYKDKAIKKNRLKIKKC